MMTIHHHHRLTVTAQPSPPKLLLLYGVKVLCMHVPKASTADWIKPDRLV